MEPLTIVVTLASGIILGAWGYALNSRRDRQAREHADKIARDSRVADYEAFLLDWEQRIEKTDTTKIPALYFNEAAALFRSRAAKVHRDFVDRAEFNRLDNALGRMSPQDIQADATRTSREKLADAIRPLIKYVQAA